ncbi:MAG: hypothetical protein H7Y41_05555 [Hyphomonadaceae bacterium]|nr:hypothetical protein [Clostridia bacterium]
MTESEAMKWVRQVRDEISTGVRDLSPKERVAYLKEQSKKAKEVMHLRSIAKV